jgi:hypothetical protein
MSKTQQIREIVPTLDGLTHKDADDKLGSLAEIHSGGRVMMNCGGIAWRDTGLRVEIYKADDGKFRVRVPSKEFVFSVPPCTPGAFVSGDKVYMKVAAFDMEAAKAIVAAAIAAR